MIKNDQTMGEGYESLTSLVARDIIAERVRIIREQASTMTDVELHEEIASWSNDDKDIDAKKTLLDELLAISSLVSSGDMKSIHTKYGVEGMRLIVQALIYRNR